MRIDDRHVFHERAVHSFAVLRFAARRRQKVCFINQNEIKRAEVAGFVIHGLDSGDDHLFQGVAGFQPCGENADFQFRAECTDFPGVLFQQLFDVRQNENTSIPVFDGVRNDFCDYNRFTGIVMDHKVSVHIQMVSIQFKTEKIIFR